MNTKTDLLALTCLVSFALPLAGCSSINPPPQPQCALVYYNGPFLPLEDVAVVKKTGGGVKNSRQRHSDKPYVASLDITHIEKVGSSTELTRRKKGEGRYFGYEHHLTPGKYAIYTRAWFIERVSVWNNKTWSLDRIVEIDAKKGTVYLIHPQPVATVKNGKIESITGHIEVESFTLSEYVSKYPKGDNFTNDWSIYRSKANAR